MSPVSAPADEMTRKFFDDRFRDVPNEAIKRAFRSWYGMLERCFIETAHAYRHYGGRGITVTPRWFEFAAFLADMGPRPKGLSLDRINNNGNYEPSNCRWATMKEQAANTRRTRTVEIGGKRMIHSDAARLAGVDAATFYRRIEKGIDPEIAVDRMRMKRHKLSRNDAGAIRSACDGGESRSSVARRFGVSPQMVSQIVLGRLWK